MVIRKMFNVKSVMFFMLFLLITQTSKIYGQCSMVVNVDSVKNSFCLNCNGTITISVQNGTTPINFLWSDGNTNQNRSGLCAGTYSVTVTDGAGCQVVKNDIVVEQVPPPTIAFQKSNASCGLCNGSILIDITGGVPPYTYSWSDGVTTEDRVNLCGGSYNFQVNDNANCATALGFSISQTGNISLETDITHLSCFGANDGSIDIAVIGGTNPFTYAWSNGATTQDIANLAAGDYTITVTDNNGCTYTTTYTVNNPPNASFSSQGASTTCGNNNGSITVTVNGGNPPFTFDWSHIPGTNNPQNLTNLASGYYEVNIYDENNCLIGGTGTNIFPSVGIEIDSIVTKASCNQSSDGAIDVIMINGFPPYVYNWNTGDTTQDIMGLDTGRYYLSIEDDLGCIHLDTIKVTSLNLPNLTYYADNDGDGYGDPNSPILSCSGIPPGYIDDDGDCDDTNFDINPGAPEIDCNGFDDNCDGDIDENSNYQLYYEDVDDDGYGKTDVLVASCNGAPPGYTALPGDCNDNNANINPGHAEIACNGVDDNCNGTTDENNINVTYYQDVDGDGYGNPDESQTTCNGAPNGYVTDNTDCDDNNSDIHPGAAEIPCTGFDENCDGEIDENSVYITYYADQDGDGYGNPAISQTTCDGAPFGYITNNTDCNDNNANINPGHAEIACNGVDDNCNGTADENNINVTYYQDVDGDGYGNPDESQTTCNGAPNGYVTDNTDCDDNNSDINPGATEIPCTGFDENCDGEIDENSVYITYYADQDGDGYGNPTISQTTCDGAPSGYVTNSTDCNDNNANINPGHAEVPCNGVDDNCNGTTDENNINVTYYQDVDGDGYGNPDESQTTCNGAPNGYVTDNTDCDDNNSDINPGVAEIPCT
ncbi:MAG: hypothetical protein K1X55_12810, partial [Chitinophagales bacterium]|nr:hypothetical protein [Chitinophagales bacterium]